MKKNFSEISKNIKSICVILSGTLILAGCSDSRYSDKQNITPQNEETQDLGTEPSEKLSQQTQKNDHELSQDLETESSEKTAQQTQKDDPSLSEDSVETPEQEVISEPEIIETDWSEYFDGLSGTAVIYDASDNKYMIYNRELAQTQSSPCSTFKIISSLIALETGIMEPDNSMYTWSGEVFWNENWNHDIDFREAFRQSCVWYFREVVDQIGQERMQEELNQLQYGNCDISDWEGRINTNNNNRALTGFWIESSLMISPKEQVEVLARIFGSDSIYSLKTQNELKQVMLTDETAEFSIYGKTGMGKVQGEVVDAWFTGFVEGTEGKKYFCVHLGKNEGREVSSSLAKEIAIQLTKDYCF